MSQEAIVRAYDNDTKTGYDTPAFRMSMIDFLCCPACKSSLDDEVRACRSCGKPYDVQGSIYIFLDSASLKQRTNDEASDGENLIKNFLKRWPNFYQWAVHVITPLLFSGLTAKKFLQRYRDDASVRVLNVGSGPTRLHQNVVNVDIFPFPNVDVIADASHLPFADDSFDLACSEQVLEHVSTPYELVSELIRVTKPGGLIYIGAPFLYPLHPSPKDYTRWTFDGLSLLYGGCLVSERGVMVGPTSGLLVYLASWLGLLLSFGIPMLRVWMTYVFMVILSPIKLCDYIVTRIPGAEGIATSLYIVLRKPGEPS